MADTEESEEPERQSISNTEEETEELEDLNELFLDSDKTEFDPHKPYGTKQSYNAYFGF